jgi:hypothetical protein
MNGGKDLMSCRLGDDLGSVASEDNIEKDNFDKTLGNANTIVIDKAKMAEQGDVSVTPREYDISFRKKWKNHGWVD